MEIKQWLHPRVGPTTSFATPFKACLWIGDARIIIQSMFNVDATMMLEDELHSELNNDRENMITISWEFRHNIHDTIWFKNVTCGKVLFAIWCVA
jgi:hypothetical protein